MSTSQQTKPECKKSSALLFRNKNESDAPKTNLELNDVLIDEKRINKYLAIIPNHKLISTVII